MGLFGKTLLDLKKELAGVKAQIEVFDYMKKIEGFWLTKYLELKERRAQLECEIDERNKIKDTKDKASKD